MENKAKRLHGTIKTDFLRRAKWKRKNGKRTGHRHIKHKVDRGLAVATIRRYMCAIDLAAELCFRANGAADDLPLPKST
ncbi:hypothetical protein [Rhodoblastus sp.]|uniref:hypothetical protein n=1 Tax=Rhodoblastus sp. TaxID=1962975 RepID=UPI0025D479B9|nr:hypothetical protein [Rhodoblastus sp.]